MINSFWNLVTGSSSPGSPGRSRPRTVSPRLVKPEYSVSYLNDQIEELISVTGKPESPRSSVPSSSTDRLVELIRAIAETLLWGDQNEEDSLMFDYFAEKGVMKVFVALLNTPTVPASTSLFSASSSGNRQIKIQLLQTMSLLLLNVKRQTSLYFLFSNNAVNQLINNTNNLDFSDEEILSYYISLMKSISLRLSGETIQFFINDKNANYFPLFSQSIRFFDHHDRMVRIAVRTITLSVFKLHSVSEGLQKFLTDNTGGYFSLLACQLRDLWFLMDRSRADEGSTRSTLPVVTDEMIDQLEYLAEIERLGIDSISDLLWSKLNIYAVDSVLVPSLCGIVDGSHSPRLDGDTVDQKTAPSKNVSQPIALFVTVQMLEVFQLNPVSASIVKHFVSQDKAWIEKDLKLVGTTYCLLTVLFRQLLEFAGQNLELMNELSEFGLFPPNSIHLVILISQSLAKDAISENALLITVGFLERFLADPTITDEFKRPVKLTISDAVKNVASRVLQLLSDTLVRKTTAASNDLDYSVIDLVEKVLLTSHEATKEEILRLTNDPNLVATNPSDDHWKRTEVPLTSLSSEYVRKFFILTRFLANSIHEDHSDLPHIHHSLFVEHDDSPSEPINSPPSPPPEFVDAESVAVDHPLGHDLKEGDAIDLGKRDRIVCTHITSPLGRSTRYLIIDSWRLLLVAPDITRPGFATIKFLIPLRSFSSVTVSRDDQRILLLESATSTTEQLGFDDLKRCHLALMHLETRRIDIRKTIYRRIEAFVKTFIHS